MAKDQRGKKNEPKGMMTQMKEFTRDSKNFFDKCKKPNKAEYLKIL